MPTNSSPFLSLININDKMHVCLAMCLDVYHSQAIIIGLLACLQM